MPLTRIKSSIILDATVTADDLAADSVNTDEIADNIVLAGTDAMTIPKGSTAQRGSGVTGKIRYNTDTNKFEGYSSAWGTLGGGATGGGSDEVFIENAQTVTTDYTLTANKNAVSAGNITINGGVTVTVPTGARWVVV